LALLIKTIALIGDVARLSYPKMVVSEPHLISHCAPCRAPFHQTFVLLNDLNPDFE
jgi:hypothetical protein